MTEQKLKEWNQMIEQLRVAFPNPISNMYADNQEHEAQRIMQNTLEILTKHGYLATGTCRCDGYYTHKFRKGSYEVRWRKSKFTFRVRYRHDSITEWQNISLLENTLNELAYKDNQAQTKGKAV